MTETPATPTRRSAGLWAALTIVLVAVNLRPAIVAVSPLLPELRADTGLSAATAALLTTLPVLCFGLLSPLAPRAARRFGIEQTIFGALVVLCAGFALRLVPDLAALFAGTVLVGAAIAFGNVLLPALIKRDFAGRVGLMTGVYSMSLSGGATIAAGLTIPIARAAHLDWRFTLGSWGLLAVAAALAWLPRLRHRHTVQLVEASPRLWRNGLAWSVTLYLGFQSLNFYSVTAWLPESFISRGMAPIEAGWLLSLTNLVSIAAATTVPIIAGRMRSQRSLAVVATTVAFVALGGLILMPQGAYGWVVLLGLSQGAALGLSLTLVVLRAADTEHAAELSGMAQSAGYLIAAAGPLIVGAAHDLTASWPLALSVLLVLLVPQAVTGFRAGRNAYVE